LQWLLQEQDILNINHFSLPLTDKAKGYIAVFITSTVWGTTWVVSKIGVTAMPAMQLVYLRQFLGGIVFVGFFLLYKKIALPTAKQFRWLFVMSLIMFVSANGLSTWGVQYIPPGIGALIGALYPLVVVIIEKLFFKSKQTNALTFMGLFLSIAGIALIFYKNSYTEQNPKFFLGIGLSVTAMISWSIGTVFMARNKSAINPYYGLGWQMLISSALIFVFMQFTNTTIPLTKIPTNAWLAIAYLVVMGSLFAFVAFIYSMKKLPTSIASLYAYINPIVATIIGIAVFNDKINTYIIIGMLITIIGVALVNDSIRRAKKVIEEAEL
jgi:drug/metabolite transporter (DMT)-like permease